jgi:hypothetical protein
MTTPAVSVSGASAADADADADADAPSRESPLVVEGKSRGGAVRAIGRV